MATLYPTPRGNNYLYLILILLGLSPLRTAAQQAGMSDSLDIKIGQMIMIGLPSNQVDQPTIDLLARGRAGAILFFEKNLPAENTPLALKQMIANYQKSSPIPLLVAIDQEGGKVNRLKTKYGFPETISARAMAQSDSVRFYAEVIASTLASLGFNLNLAPVVDLAANPKSPAIAGMGRAFAASPDSVTQCASVFIDAHHRLGIATTLKHFPGHGSAANDTHLGMVDVTSGWTRAELTPYQKLLANHQVDAIMTAHVINRNLDPRGRPATLSRRMIDSLLRRQMGYTGVVISDDMQMHAITKHYGLETAIRYAVEAGVDMLVFSNNIHGSAEQTADRVHATIRKLVDQQIISADRIQASFDRIMALKRRIMEMAKAWKN